MCAIPVAQPSALDCSYAVVGVAAGNFLGVQRIFPKFPKLARENSKDNDPKERLHFILGVFFQIRILQARFCQNFSQNLPKFRLSCPKITKKHDLQENDKCLHFDVRRHFCEIKPHKVISRRFSHI